MDRKALIRTFAAGAAIFVLALAVYIPVMGGGFIWDDDWLITDNPRMKTPDGLVKFWRGGYDPDYYPLNWTSLWVEYQLWGDKPLEVWGVHINGYHVSNILMHAVSAVLVWQVLRRLKIPGAWLAGVIFAVHPVNVATVAWISERKNTLSMIFYLAAILAFLDFDSRRDWRWYVASLAAFVLALLSKTSVVMTPMVLLGCLWWRRNRIGRRDLLAAAPFFLLSMGAAALGIWFQTNRVIADTVIHSPGENFFWRLAMAGTVPWFYLYKALLPVNLAAIYPRWQIDTKSIVSFLPGLALLGCAAIFWRYRNGWGKPALMAMGYLLLSLFPVLGFFDMYYLLFSLVADHWQYVAIVGTIALAAGTGTWWARRQGQSVRRLAGVAAGVVVAVLSILTWRHAGVYSDLETLWRDNVAKYPTAWMAYFNLAGPVDNNGHAEEAIADYKTCIRINPAYDKAYVNIGTMLFRQGKSIEAAEWYAQAIAVNPRSAMAHSNLAVMLHTNGRTQEALGHLYTAIADDDRYFDAHANLGTILDTLGQYDEAIKQWRISLELRDARDIRLLLASLLAKRGADQEAVKEYTLIVRGDPNFADGFFQLGLLWAKMGDIGRAKEYFQHVLELKPDYVDAYNNLAVLWIQTARPDLAVKCFRQALRFRPNDANANYNLAITLASAGLLPEAVVYYRQAANARADWAEPRISLARILATSTDDGVRNGALAVQLAKDACRLTNSSRPDALETLAAAYAETGRFAEAVTAANQALELARASKQEALVADITARLAAYSASRPWRQAAPPVNPSVAAAIAE